MISSCQTSLHAALPGDSRRESLEKRDEEMPRSRGKAPPQNSSRTSTCWPLIETWDPLAKRLAPAPVLRFCARRRAGALASSIQRSEGAVRRRSRTGLGRAAAGDRGRGLGARTRRAGAEESAGPVRRRALDGRGAGGRGAGGRHAIALDVGRAHVTSRVARAVYGRSIGAALHRGTGRDRAGRREEGGDGESQQDQFPHDGLLSEYRVHSINATAAGAN